jgi:hypothetical protein
MIRSKERRGKGILKTTRKRKRKLPLKVKKVKLLGMVRFKRAKALQKFSRIKRQKDKRVLENHKDRVKVSR